MDIGRGKLKCIRGCWRSAISANMREAGKCQSQLEDTLPEGYNTSNKSDIRQKKKKKKKGGGGGGEGRSPLMASETGDRAYIQHSRRKGEGANAWPASGVP